MGRWYAERKEGVQSGPFDDCESAILSFVHGSYETWGGRSHEGFVVPAGAIAVIGVSPLPTAAPSPIDLFPKKGSRYGRAEARWMIDRILGTVFCVPPAPLRVVSREDG
jgi:hypothetical protein